MNLRCFYCQTMFALSTAEKLAALQMMQTEGLHHYDAYCPRCRRANPISRERLELFTPGWQLALQGAATPSPQGKPAAPKTSSPAPRWPTAARAKPAPTSSPKGKPAVPRAPVAKKPAVKKPTAPTSSPKGKPAAPVAKKAAKARLAPKPSSKGNAAAAKAGKKPAPPKPSAKRASSLKGRAAAKPKVKPAAKARPAAKPKAAAKSAPPTSSPKGKKAPTKSK